MRTIEKLIDKIKQRVRCRERYREKVYGKRGTLITHEKDSDTVTIMAEERWSVAAIKKCQDAYPWLVKIIDISDDGRVEAEIPLKWLKISCGKKLNNEQRRIIGDRLQSAVTEARNRRAEERTRTETAQNSITEKRT